MKNTSVPGNGSSSAHANEREQPLRLIYRRVQRALLAQEGIGTLAETASLVPPANLIFFAVGYEFCSVFVLPLETFALDLPENERELLRMYTHR
jgi:hypothetical protein